MRVFNLASCRSLYMLNPNFSYYNSKVIGMGLSQWATYTLLCRRFGHERLSHHTAIHTFSHVLPSASSDAALPRRKTYVKGFCRGVGEDTQNSWRWRLVQEDKNPKVHYLMHVIMEFVDRDEHEYWLCCAEPGKPEGCWGLISLGEGPHGRVLQSTWREHTTNFKKLPIEIFLLYTHRITARGGDD